MIEQPLQIERLAKFDGSEAVQLIPERPEGTVVIRRY